ncbi:MAG: hypothetical protein IT355_06110 [Gemmatimonadaceae bacterium]|nr:hypothetical protein [Gemmatimonadaceae bacterium]
MTSFPMLPPVPRPPHDPSVLTLDAGRGWRAAFLDAAVIAARDGALQLDLTAGARDLHEPSGSLGGLVPPAWVTVSEAGDIWLLDRASGRLAKFDDCDCRFVTVPHTGGLGVGARQFTDPRGIVATCGNLVVVDRGAARLSVFSQRGYALREHVTPPASAQPVPWQPTCIAADAHGHLYVGDPANGAVHRFSTRGVWLSALVGLGDVQHLAVDRHNRLYVVVSTLAEVLVFAHDGTPLEAATSRDAIARRFAPLPFRVTPAGVIDFSHHHDCCCEAFDATGAALPGGAPATKVTFATAGSYRSAPLDSDIAQCQWHRVTLTAAIPPGCSVTVYTRTSELAEPDDLVAALPDAAWETRAVARRAAGSDGACVEWDCLVRSGPGRFAWLELRLQGDGKGTPRVHCVTIESPRVSLSRWLPGVFVHDPDAGDFTDRFLSLFDTTLRSIESRLDLQAGLFDPRSTPAESPSAGAPDFLSWLAGWVGIALDRSWPEARRREYLRRAPALFDERGTVAGLRSMLLLYLGLRDDRREPSTGGGCGCAATAARCEPRVDPCAAPPPRHAHRAPALLLEHWRLRRWLFVGGARLGEDAALWGNAIVSRSRLGDGARTGVTRLIGTQDPFRDPMHVYASTFTVFVPASLACDATARRGLEALLRDESPAHTRWHLEYVAPRFRVGVQSMIGYDSVVGRYPAPGVTVDQSTLGRSTILGGPPGDPVTPPLRVGTSARIGSTTTLQ